jgi:hypothetical protein
VVDVARLDTDERAAVVAAQRAGRVVAGDPSDVMALVITHAERPRSLRQAVRAATST